MNYELRLSIVEVECWRQVRMPTSEINCTPTNPAARAAIQSGPKKGIPSIHD